MRPLSQLSTPVTLLPAYGRKYSTKEAAVNDWKAGKDFKIAGGSYCSIRDIELLKSEASTVWIDILHTVVRII